MERPDKVSNRAFYDTERADDRRRFDLQGSKRFVGETLLSWLVPQLFRGDRVLDIAGGSGVYASQIARAAGVTVVGVDISDSMVRQRGEDPSLPLNVVGDMEALPFASGSFDAVLFIAALHHVPDALPALREASRVLRPGGRLFAREPCSLMAARRGAAPIAGHEQEFRISRSYLVDRAQRAGFTIDEMVGLQLTMRLVGRLVREPSLRAFRAGAAADRILFRVPGLAALGEGCMLAATKPGTAPGRGEEAGELDALLACPACRGALRGQDGRLVCEGCAAVYAVEDGVRVLLPSSL
jgi:SAM-dependent methyltransferase